MRHLTRFATALAVVLSVPTASAIVWVPPADHTPPAPTMEWDMQMSSQSLLPRSVAGTVMTADGSELFLSMNMRNARVLSSGKIAFSGWNIYRTEQGGETVRRVMIMGTLTPATGVVRVFEVNEVRDFSVAETYFEGTATDGGTMMDLVLRGSRSGGDVGSALLVSPAR